MSATSTTAGNIYNSLWFKTTTIMENTKQGTAVLVHDELAPTVMLKTRGEKPASERRQSDESLQITPERPRSSLRYNTPITPVGASRSRAVSYESKASISPGYESDDRSTDGSPPSVLGPGAVKGGPIYNQRRTSFPRPQPPGRKRSHTPRLPSWHSTSKEPVHSITKSLNRISNFTRTVDTSSETDTFNFRLFLDANKEIVAAWHVIEDREIKDNPVLEEKVDCMHAILAAWSIGNEVDHTGNWLMQALQLTNLNREFAEVWEAVTGVEIDPFGPDQRSEEDIFTSPSELATDQQRKVEAVRIEAIKFAAAIKIEECKIEEREEIKKENIIPPQIDRATDEKSKAQAKGRISTSPRESTMNEETEVKDEAGIFTSPTKSNADGEPSSDETIEFLAPLYPIEHYVAESEVEVPSSNGGSSLSTSPSQKGDRSPSRGSNSFKVSHGPVSSTILSEPSPKQPNFEDASRIHESLEKIEALLQQLQKSKPDDGPTLQKINNLEELVVQRSDTQATTADQHLKRIEGHIHQETSQTAENIKADLKERLDKIESGLLQQKPQPRPADPRLSLETLETVFDQHLGIVEPRFVGKFDQIQNSVDKLSNQHSSSSTSFLNQLTKLNSNPPGGSNSLDKHLGKFNEGISIISMGTMIQQVYLDIFRDWEALSLDQKRSSVYFMKKLVANWHEKYRTKMSLVDAMITDLKSMPSETENIERVTARTTEFKESAQTMKADIDMVDECMTLYGEALNSREQMEAKMALIKAKKEELAQTRMNSHWVYTALDEAVDICWPQGDPESNTNTDTDTDSESESEHVDFGNQLGKHGGGNGGGCVMM